MQHQEQYDLNPGLRRSDLWAIHISPQHFKFLIDNRHLTNSESKGFGVAMHKYLLEPETFFDEFILAPTVDRRTKAGKETWNQFMETCTNEEKEPITASDFETIQAMTEAALSNTLVKQLLNGPKEEECYWQDPVTGEPLKAKMDCITTYNGKKYLVDYKTTDSCQDGHFERSSSKYGYQFQTGFYLSGIEATTQEKYGFIFIAQEKKPPYACRVYLCSDNYMEQGKAQFRNYLDLYHNCKLTNNWYGYDGDNQNPQPTILMDDAERWTRNRTMTSYNSIQFGSYESMDTEDHEENFDNID